jgi:hypothetical protein
MMLRGNNRLGGPIRAFVEASKDAAATFERMEP